MVNVVKIDWFSGCGQCGKMAGLAVVVNVVRMTGLVVVVNVVSGGLCGFGQ